jgi:hypothetical protein
MEELKFNVKALCLSPFTQYFKWAGFKRDNQIILSDSEITIQKKKKTESYSYDQLDFCIVKRRWLSFSNSCVYLGYSDEEGQIKGGYFYIPSEHSQKLLDELKKRNAKCFSPSKKVITAKSPWFSLNRNKDTLWLNSRYVISSRLAIKSILSKPQPSLQIGSIKFFFTKNGNLRMGPNPQLVVKHVSKANILEANDYLAAAGCQVCAKMDEAFESIDLGFTHATVGYNENGVIYSYKDFRNVDKAFLPYEKINLYYSWWSFPGWYMIVLGEQNIEPGVRFKRADVDKLHEKLKEHGVESTDGGLVFRSSLHTSWFGVLFSWLTLGIYHLLLAFFLKFKKRPVKSILVCGDKVLTRGKIYRHTIEDATSALYKGGTACAAKVKDVKAVIYRKERWFYLWGDVYVRLQPENIREDVDSEGNSSVKYDFAMNNVWPWRYRALKGLLKVRGYDPDRLFIREYKKWVKDNEGSLID